MQRAKVFGVGFHKTGTTSLGKAFKLLGLRTCGAHTGLAGELAAGRLEGALALAERHDAFEDNPWPLLFRELDQHFPGSRFVLTVRDPDDWLRSVLRHFGARRSAMRRYIYGHGAPLNHEVTYRERLLRHQREVLEYFAPRPSDLLVMDLRAGHGWEQLCPFLRLPIPTAPFPHLNRRG